MNMAKKRSLPDWLPAGWKVEVRAPKNRKKHKWYGDPSKGLKFCSKADVPRYLSRVGSNCSKSSNTKEMMKNDTGKFSSEKLASEGLPPGWIKEMRVRKKGRKIRKDLYYTHPVSGQTFRSLKEVFRFLETRESGILESKPGNQCPNTSEVGESFSSLPAEADKQISRDSNADDKDVNLNQKLKLRHMAHSSCVDGNASSFEDLGGAVLEKAEDEDDSKVNDDGKFVSDHVSGGNQEKPSQDGVEKHDQKTNQRKRKKDLNLPRRTSKRLAGIKAEASLKPQTNAHLATVRQEEIQAAPIYSPLNVINTSEHVATAATGITFGEKVETGSMPSSCEGESSLTNIWTDPCIEFAIKTLTGTLPVNEKKVTEIPGPCPSMRSVNTPSVEMALPCDEIWADPCFMFAVKTLTGEIPVGDDLGSQKIVQQQYTTPSQSQWSNGLVLQNMRFQEFGLVNLSDFEAPEKALYKQQPAVVAPNAYQNCWFSKFGSCHSSPLC